jgi:thioredoxin reductase (NADPH)
MERIYDMIIVGGGPGGYTAALYGARAGLKVLVIEKLSAGGQMALSPMIDNYPGFDEGIDGFTLGMKMQQGAEKYGAKTIYGEATAVKLKGTTKEIITAEETLLAKTVVIATGADPKTLGLDGEADLTGRGVHYCAHCDGRFYKDKTVMVIGGGDSAASDALYLSRLCKKVILVHRRDTLRATKIYHAPLMAAENVSFRWNSRPAALLRGEDGRLIGATLELLTDGSTENVLCDGIFVSIGRRPVTEFLGGALDTVGGYLIADESTRTAIPGVYAAGDVRTKELRQVVTAVSDGAQAVHFAQEYLATLI